MRVSFKTTTLIAAIGIIGFTIYMVAHYAIREFYPTPYCYDLWSDISTRILFDTLPLCLIVVCVGLFKYRPTENASKPFKILTLCLFLALVGTLLFSHLYTIYIGGRWHLFPPVWWRVIVLTAGIVWLFMLRRQPVEDAKPRSYQMILIIAMVILAFPIMMEMISGLTYCTYGQILCLNSYVFKPWVRWIAPTLVLVHFVFKHPRIA